MGIGSGDRWWTSTGLWNTIFLVESAADLYDDYSTVAAHEAGHVLFNGVFPGSDPVDVVHAKWAEPQNLMYPEVAKNQIETIGGPKRLTVAQQNDARCDSAELTAGITCDPITTLTPPTTPPERNPVLLQKKEKNQ